MPNPSKLAREMREGLEGVSGEWRYNINYGPDGQEDWANLITPEGEHVANIRTHHAMRIVANMTNRAALLADRVSCQARVEELERTQATMESALGFVSRWAWRTDPPNTNNKLTDAERFSAIKFHPTIMRWADPHIKLAEREAAARSTLEGK